MRDEITGIKVVKYPTYPTTSDEYFWTYLPTPDTSIKEGDMVVITAQGTAYEVIAEVYSLYVGETTDTLSVLGSDNHIYTMSPKAYYDARKMYLELYDGKDVSIGLNTPTDDGSCHHYRTEVMRSCVLLETYEWQRCLQCGEEV